jgi:hypothetical protein
MAQMTALTADAEAGSLSQPVPVPPEWLEHVAGGLNPQPLPPYHEDRVTND